MSKQGGRGEMVQARAHLYVFPSETVECKQKYEINRYMRECENDPIVRARKKEEEATKHEEGDVYRWGPEPAS